MQAEDHCALNVCLYGAGQGRWTMTERGRRHVERKPRHFVIGPSRVEWDGRALAIDIDERGAPLPRAVLGRVLVHPLGLSRLHTPLDDAGRHRWGPIAPCARVEVELQQPALRWTGHGYLDSNEGDEPIERAFDDWDWMRARLPDGRCAVIYDARTTAGADRLLSLRFAADGTHEPAPAPTRQPLAPTRWWRIARAAHHDGHAPPRVRATLEDTPFYARSLLDLSLHGSTVTAMHETLGLHRLTHPLVQRMLPFRMPRVT